MTLLKSLLPGSIAFLLMGLAAGLLMTRRAGRAAVWGRRWLIGLTAVYLVMSTPAGSAIVARPLSWGFRPLARAEDASGARAVVVLDGGTDRCYAAGRLVEQPNAATISRAAEAVRVAMLLGEPLVIVTGGTTRPSPGAAPDGEMLRQAVIRLGIPPARVILDPESFNTRAHAVSVTQLLRRHGIARFVLVTSDAHIRRASAAFRHEAAEFVASPAATCARPDGAFGWWPGPSSLARSEAAVHEYAGLIYYALRGWL